MMVIGFPLPLHLPVNICPPTTGYPKKPIIF